MKAKNHYVVRYYNMAHDAWRYYGYTEGGQFSTVLDINLAKRYSLKEAKQAANVFRCEFHDVCYLDIMES